ncbi:MAG: DUF2934 domain-containing protein [Magnetospirillum sp. WYHS-4]
MTKTTGKAPVATAKAAAPKAKVAPPPKSAKPKSAAKPAARKGNGGSHVPPAAQDDAYYLSEAAIMLDQARSGKKRDAKKLAAALENELEVWTAIRTAVLRWSDQEREVTKQNVCRLSDFIAGTILSSGVNISDSTLDTLININLQIAEGLLEGHVNQRIRDEAYKLWEAEGRTVGRDQEYWFRAEELVRNQA